MKNRTISSALLLFLLIMMHQNYSLVFMVPNFSTTLFCKENYRFWCLEKANVLKKFFLVGKYASFERFRKVLGISDFHFLYIL